jgi:hypothetical protein
MKYKEFVEDNDIDDIGKPISIDIKAWKEAGDTLTGELLQIGKFEGGKFESECNTYLFKTDEGLVTTILGASIDKAMEENDLIGRILHIRYKGKTDLGDGRSCNRFGIVDITEAWKKAVEINAKVNPDE